MLIFVLLAYIFSVCLSALRRHAEALEVAQSLSEGVCSNPRITLVVIQDRTLVLSHGKHSMTEIYFNHHNSSTRRLLRNSPDRILDSCHSMRSDALRCGVCADVKSDEDDDVTRGNHVLNCSDMSQGIMGVVTAVQAVQECTSGDDLKRRELMLDKSMDRRIYRWTNRGCMSKWTDDWCIAEAEQTIFLSPSKEHSDRNWTWPCQRLEMRHNHTHTHEGTSLNLRRTVFDASKVRGPVMHKHSRQPRGPQVQSTEAARVARIFKKNKKLSFNLLVIFLIICSVLPK